MATKTKSTVRSSDIKGYIAGIEDEGRRKDAQQLVKIMQSVTGDKPAVWGTDGFQGVGFGQYHYKYASGHEGDTCYVGFAPRKTEFSIYLTGTYFPGMEERRAALLAKLGKHKMGKACLYVKRLSDIDTKVLAELIDMSVTALKEHYPSTAGASA